MLQKDLKGAEEVLRKACEASPKLPDPQTALGEYYLAVNRPADAAQAFQRALQLDPKSLIALRDLAVLENQQGRKKEAEDKFKTLAASGNEAYKPIYGMFLFSENRKEEALAEFKRIVKADPADRAARTRLVNAYLVMNRKADAKSVLDQALRKNPKDFDALLQRGRLLIDAGQYAEAESDLNSILQQRPDSADAHYLTGRLFQGSRVRAALQTRSCTRHSSWIRRYLMSGWSCPAYSLPIKM